MVLSFVSPKGYRDVAAVEAAPLSETEINMALDMDEIHGLTTYLLDEMPTIHTMADVGDLNMVRIAVHDLIAALMAEHVAAWADDYRARSDAECADPADLVTT